MTARALLGVVTERMAPNRSSALRARHNDSTVPLNLRRKLTAKLLQFITIFQLVGLLYIMAAFVDPTLYMADLMTVNEPADLLLSHLFCSLSTRMRK
jgi:hypothetical protein